MAARTYYGVFAPARGETITVTRRDDDGRLVNETGRVHTAGRDRGWIVLEDGRVVSFDIKPEALPVPPQTATDPRYYWDEWDTYSAEEAGTDANGVLSSPAPFGDNTCRVIDNEDGVIAYTGSPELAGTITAALNTAAL